MSYSVASIVRVCTVLMLGGLLDTVRAASLEEQPPNILFILADDLGYGDVACYNPESKIPTPNLDKLAADGMRFTDAHSPSTVCTPTCAAIVDTSLPNDAAEDS